MRRLRVELIERIRRKLGKDLGGQAGKMRRVAELLDGKNFVEALEAARRMDTNAREEIPPWGWDMLRKAAESQKYLENLG